MSVQNIRRGVGKVPVYIQISESLSMEIQDLYKAGDQLPSEGELAQRFNVNRHTLRRAIDELIQKGIVVRRHGKGVFVVSSFIDYSINTQTRFTETLENQGKVTDSKVTKKIIIPARGGIASRLGIENGSDVISLETLRTVDDVPFCVISHFLPLKDMEIIYEKYNKGSLHNFVKKHCGVELKRKESLISSVMPEPGDAELLKMPRNLPVLRVKSLNVSIDTGIPVEYVVTRFRGDATQLLVQP